MHLVQTDRESHDRSVNENPVVRSRLLSRLAYDAQNLQVNEDLSRRKDYGATFNKQVANGQFPNTKIVDGKEELSLALYHRETSRHEKQLKAERERQGNDFLRTLAVAHRRFVAFYGKIEKTADKVAKELVDAFSW